MLGAVVDVHGAELEKGERLAILADARLPEEDGPFGVSFTATAITRKIGENSSKARQRCRSMSMTRLKSPTTACGLSSRFANRDTARIPAGACGVSSSHSSGNKWKEMLIWLNCSKVRLSRSALLPASAWCPTCDFFSPPQSR